MISRRTAGALVALAVLRLSATAGGAPPPAPRQQGTAFTSRTTGVRVDALVTKGNRPVAGLTAADFDVRDNGVPQAVDVVETSGPINAVLALDASASLKGAKLRDVIAAGGALVAALEPGDRVALTTFNQSAYTPLALTADFASVSAALHALAPDGDSAIAEGVYVALVQTLTQPGRSLVVVCTDGRNTAGFMGDEEVVEAAKRANAVVYPVFTGGGRRPELLAALADATGGSVVDAARAGDLAGAVRKILDEFHSRYVLTYTPRGVEARGLHRLEVRVKTGGLAVRHRSGYISGGAP